MHISGKIAAWLVALGIVISIYFSAKAFALRDKWMQVAQENEKKIKENDEELAKKRKLLNEKKVEFARTMLGWDRQWSDVQVAGNPQTGLTLGIGTGKGVQPDQVLYVFVLNADNQTPTYVGDFKVSKPGDAQVDVKPYSRRRPNDPKQLPSQSARVRTMLPNAYLARLGGLDEQLLAADLTITGNKEELDRQALLLQQAESLIAARMAEIDGNPKLEGKQIPPVHTKGLLTSIADEDEARNAALIEADRLMRALKKSRDEFAETRKDNEQRVQSLPKPVPQEPAVGSAGR
jgi:hypothetical protein